MLVSPLGACLPSYKLWAPLSFQLLGAQLELHSYRVLPLVLGETEAQNVPWPEASEPGFKLRAPSSRIPAHSLPSTHKSVSFGDDSEVLHLVQPSPQPHEGLSY